MQCSSQQLAKFHATAVLTLSLALCPAPAKATELAVRSAPWLTISRDGEALHVKISYAQPVREHLLGPGLAPLHGNSWRITDGDREPQLEQGRIVANHDWQRASLEVAADARRFDRVYGANLPLGTCGQLVRPGAFTDAAEIDVKFETSEGDVLVSPLRSQTAAPGAREAPLRFVANEMTYFGRPECVRHGAGATWIYDSDQVPEALVAVVERSLDGALKSLPALLAAEPSLRPVVAIRYLGSGDGFVSWHGDVDAKGMIVVEVSGPISDGLLEQLEGFIVHEAFHLWNGATFRQNPERSRAWLSEGMAEYAALKLLRETGRIEGRAYFAGLSQRFNGCLAGTGIREGGGSVGVDALDGNGGRLVYDCGTVIQWLADNALSGDADIFTVWSAMFAEARDSNEYDAAGFLRQLRTYTGDARIVTIQWLINGGASKATSELVAALDVLGIAARDASDDGDNPGAVQTVLMHLLEQHCSGGSYGFVTETDRLVLDTGDRCGPMNGDPVVITIQGHRIGSEDSMIYDAAAEACARSADVVLKHEESVVNVPCNRPLPPLPARLQIERDGLPASAHDLRERDFRQ